MAPIVHGLEAQYVDRMNFVYLDIDDPSNDTFKDALDYIVQPHLFLLDADGKVIQQWLGSVPAADLEKAFKDALGSD